MIPATNKSTHSDVLLTTPGVWLLGGKANLVLRDGPLKTDPVKRLSMFEPTWFAKLRPAQFIADREVIVVPNLPPPATKADELPDDLRSASVPAFDRDAEIREEMRRDELAWMRDQLVEQGNQLRAQREENASLRSRLELMETGPSSEYVKLAVESPDPNSAQVTGTPVDVGARSEEH